MLARRVLIILLGIVYSLIFSKSTVQANPMVSCDLDIEQLTEKLLKDLPDYTNRVIRSAQSLERSDLQVRHVIVTAKPDFESIQLSQRQYTPTFTDSSNQVFFTSLERIYVQGKAVEVQGFHWLFLAKTDKGWDFFTLVSSRESNNILIPPRENNQTAIAQAIRIWLRDYQFSCVVEKSA